MYLISLYFDEVSCGKIQRLINKSADKSGNSFMIDNQVPPHITVSAFQTDEEKKVIDVLDKIIKDMRQGTVTWASIGVFKSSIIFLSPILNEYVHNLSTDIYKGISLLQNISISKFYRPFQWMPHTTIAKQLNGEELKLAFEEVQKNFNIFSGRIVKVGLSRTEPKKDIVTWNLEI